MLDNAIIKGNLSASLTLVDLSDFQCPYCLRYFTDTYPQIMENYVNAGKIKYDFMHFPLQIHLNAKPAAIAAQCANDQNKFWMFHDKLYSTQSDWKSVSQSDAVNIFKKYASELGLEPSIYNSCIDSKKYDNKINQEIQTNSKFVSWGTPTFYIGNDKVGYTQINGPQPYSSFQQLIGQLLNS
jgi:protein-disulfide isomerase